ncbi:hypothetical protein [Halocatena salina]|uniref:Uncharacterized protein n=1 Tax=Halocatena salina TaxID=2934340 RepID=A0A8U0A629_9EURY|nr:hypothetical protein [Halocatena salina]UPM44336.1 hypothetical protein MW046_15110 [Halocatena salina]
MADTDSNSASREHGLSLSRRSVLALLGMGAMAQPGGGREAQNDRDVTDRGDVALSGEGTSISIEDVLPGDEFGQITVEGLQHALPVSGTRRQSWMMRPFPKDIDATSPTYEDTDTEIGYGVVPFAPGRVPVLRIVGHFDAPREATASIRVSIANRPAYQPPRAERDIVLDDDPTRRTVLEVTGQGRTQVFDEVYLSEVKDVVTGFRNSAPLRSHTLHFEVKRDRSCDRATISNATTVALELEAL